MAPEALPAMTWRGIPVSELPDQDLLGAWWWLTDPNRPVDMGALLGRLTTDYLVAVSNEMTRRGLNAL